MKKITTRQLQVLDAIQEYQLEHGYTPTVRELCKLLDVTSPATIHGILQKLKQHDRISYEPKTHRAITVHYYDEEVD